MRLLCVLIIVSLPVFIHACIFSLCGCTSICAGSVCVHIRQCVSPWLQCDCGVLAEDTGTQSPAGEGDEAQLGIIKPSTVSMKGPGSQAGLVSPRQSSLDWDWLHHSLPSLCSRIRGKGTNLTAAQQWKYVWIKTQRAWLCCYFPKWTILCDANHSFSSPLICAFQW